MALSTSTLKKLPVISSRPQNAVIRPNPSSRVVVRASGEAESETGFGRRATVLLAVPFLLASRPTHAAFLDFFDRRGSGAKESMQSADQARDDKVDQRDRFSYESTMRLTNVDHQARAKESYSRLSKDVKPLLDKKLLNRVAAETRHQLGTLRYDLEKISDETDKSSRKQKKAEEKAALKALEQMDLYARQGKADEAVQAYGDAMQKLGKVVQSFG